MKLITVPGILVLAPIVLASCASSKVQTKESQAAITPQQAVLALKEGNARFASGRSISRNLVNQAIKTDSAQYPIAAVLGCIDSRVSNELVFDQGIGDIFSARVAGNVVNNDILGSLEFAVAKAGAKAIVVLGHTRCGAVIGACTHTEFGHLTSLLQKIRPAVHKVAAEPHVQSSGPQFEDRVAEENVKLVIDAIRERSPILRNREQSGDLVITGGIYNLDTRKVEFFDNPT